MKAYWREQPRIFTVGYGSRILIADRGRVQMTTGDLVRLEAAPSTPTSGVATERLPRSAIVIRCHAWGLMLLEPLNAIGRSFGFVVAGVSRERRHLFVLESGSEAKLAAYCRGEALRHWPLNLGSPGGSALPWLKSQSGRSQRGSAVGAINVLQIPLSPDEQVTLCTDAENEFDVTRKEWGWYASPSFEGRMKQFGFRAALIDLNGPRYFAAVLVNKVSILTAELAPAGGVVHWLDLPEAPLSV